MELILQFFGTKKPLFTMAANPLFLSQPQPVVFVPPVANKQELDG